MRYEDFDVKLCPAREAVGPDHAYHMPGSYECSIDHGFGVLDREYCKKWRFQRPSCEKKCFAGYEAYLRELDRNQ